MKLVDVAEFYAEKGGGVRTYIDRKLRAGTVLGHEVVIVAPGPEDREESRDGGRIVWVKSPPVPLDPRYHLFVRPSAIHAVLDRERPDVVEGSSPYGGGWAVATWRGAAAKSLIHHQDPVAVFGHSLLDRVVPARGIDTAFFPVWMVLRRLARRFDTTVVAGEWLRERLASFGVPRVVAVPFGIEPGPFFAAQPDPELRREMVARAGLEAGAPLLVCVSRHHPEKRLPTLIRAVHHVNRATPLALAIFGDGPSRPAVERAARRGPGVYVAGYTRDRDELARAVASADALLHGSAAETYGLVLAEALCAGTPLIVPDAGGAADLARPEHSETYRAGDAAGCAAAIRRMLVRDPVALRSAARADAATRIRTLDQHFEALFAHYAALSQP
mgnify:CR=1 FL=1